MTEDKESQGSQADAANPFQTGGYQGEQKGYSADVTRGYSANTTSQQSELPPPPQGGSGVVQVNDQGGGQQS